ncbi:hypothetical protein ACLKA6_019817 [Drosophila palustris]
MLSLLRTAAKTEMVSGVGGGEEAETEAEAEASPDCPCPALTGGPMAAAGAVDRSTFRRHQRTRASDASHPRLLLLLVHPLTLPDSFSASDRAGAQLKGWAHEWEALRLLREGG